MPAPDPRVHRHAPTPGPIPEARARPMSKAKPLAFKPKAFKSKGLITPMVLINSFGIGEKLKKRFLSIVAKPSFIPNNSDRLTICSLRSNNSPIVVLFGLTKKTAKKSNTSTMPYPILTK